MMKVAEEQDRGKHCIRDIGERLNYEHADR